MRKIHLLALAAVISFSACNDSGTATKQDDETQKNIAAARTVARAFETGDVAAIDSVVADDFVDHTDRGDKKGKDSLKAMVSFVHNNFKDMKMETLKELADKEHVFQWMRYTGTSDGAMGMPAGPFDMHAIEVTKFRNGKAVEHWAYMDMAEMSKMMGAAQHNNSMEDMHKPAAADTTKK